MPTPIAPPALAIGGVGTVVGTGPGRWGGVARLGLAGHGVGWPGAVRLRG